MHIRLCGSLVCHEISNNGHNKTERIYWEIKWTPLLFHAEPRDIWLLIWLWWSLANGEQWALCLFYKLSTFNCDLYINAQKLYQMCKGSVLRWLVVSKSLIQRAPDWKTEHNREQVIHFYGIALFCCYSRMVSPQWGCWERDWLNPKIRNWDIEMSES